MSAAEAIMMAKLDDKNGKQPNFGPVADINPYYASSTSSLKNENFTRAYAQKNKIFGSKNAANPVALKNMQVPIQPLLNLGDASMSHNGALTTSNINATS